MGIISLKYDVSFKYLMLNENVRRHFISDVLGVPMEEIRSVRLGQTFLWRRLRKHKAGVLDVLVELNDDSKVNIELQIRMISHWDRRNLFYLAKTFTEDLLIGEDYRRLKRCICISILDFNLDQRPEYHKVYRLRDQDGYEYSDLFEVHVIELRKTLRGAGNVDDWIQLMNAGTEEELDMIKTKNPGIVEAIGEVKRMSLRKELHALYEAHMKAVRDQRARDDYVREQGMNEGLDRGRIEGRAEAVLELLETRGKIPNELRARILSVKDSVALKELLVCAAQAESVSEFEAKANL